MSEHRWQLLEEVQAGLLQTADLPEGALYAIAERLDEAISAPSRAELDALQPQLAGLFTHLLKLAPPEAIHAVRKSAASSVAGQATYTLGQVSFAQMLASQARERRVGDDFAQLLQDSRFKPYVDALASKDCTGVELADICNVRVETVSRNLKLLRELGITEFRREGTHFINFLTPAARSLLPAVEATVPEPDATPSFKRNKIAQMTASAQPYMQHVPLLATTQPKAA